MGRRRGGHGLLGTVRPVPAPGPMAPGRTPETCRRRNTGEVHAAPSVRTSPNPRPPHLPARLSARLSARCRRTAPGRHAPEQPCSPAALLAEPATTAGFTAGARPDMWTFPRPAVPTGPGHRPAHGSPHTDHLTRPDPTYGPPVRTTCTDPPYGPPARARQGEPVHHRPRTLTRPLPQTLTRPLTRTRARRGSGARYTIDWRAGSLVTSCRFRDRLSHQVSGSPPGARRSPKGCFP